MKNFAKLFQFLELTRSQPQYGYAIAGIKKADLSDLAAHHYLVALFALLLARTASAAGGKLDIGKTVEFALVHDLGELLGGDIAMPYARANPKARRLAKAFEQENLRYMSRFFGNYARHFRNLTSEILNARSDESLVAKLADYYEVTHYKLYMGQLTAGDVAMAVSSMKKKLQKIKDPVSRKALGQAMDNWRGEVLKLTPEIFEAAKK